MQGLEAIHWQSLQAHDCTMPRDQVRQLLALDLELNAQGLAIWLDKPATRPDAVQSAAIRSG